MTNCLNATCWSVRVHVSHNAILSSGGLRARRLVWRPLFDILARSIIVKLGRSYVKIVASRNGVESCDEMSPGRPTTCFCTDGCLGARHLPKAELIPQNVLSTDVAGVGRLWCRQSTSQNQMVIIEKIQRTLNVEIIYDTMVHVLHDILILHICQAHRTRIITVTKEQFCIESIDWQSQCLHLNPIQNI